jgi:hypothetical protein
MSRGGRIPAIALGGYGVDASLTSFWLKAA